MPNEQKRNRLSKVSAQTIRAMRRGFGDQDEEKEMFIYIYIYIIIIIIIIFIIVIIILFFHMSFCKFIN